MIRDFVFATFTFGNFYYSQTNRLIETSLLINEKDRPKILIITDNCNAITKANHVICENIKIYEPKYKELSKKYQDFDFSIKRFSIYQALNHGYLNIVLVDNDIIFLPENYNSEIIKTFFEPNTISGPTVYFYGNDFLNNNNISHGLYLGHRFKDYLYYFDGITDSSKYINMNMPEDCITYFSFLNIEQGFEYVNIWEQCRNYKYSAKLNVAPVGNIDEICYAAIKLNMRLEIAHTNNKYKMFYPDHIRGKHQSSIKTVNTLQEFYKLMVSEIGSDIFEHMPTLTKYSLECDHITEFGTRRGSSTIAFLMGNRTNFISYDLYPTDEVYKLIELSKNENVNFNFKIQDVVHDDFVIDETDLLFIDTLHTYEQLKKELKMHCDKVKKYIIMHDTYIFKHSGENGDKNKGLKDAIDEFLENNDKWEIKEEFINNNGLTILKRI